ncbi:MAG TPA: hypothetical protein VFQ92_17265, partial [Blastocatellia bacterium]|nr:hypothetical protein [Blastocatellia bacterium]
MDDNTSNNKTGKDHRSRDKNDKSSDKSTKDGAGSSGEGPETDEEKKKAAQQQERILPRGATILVGDRPLTGPFSSPQVRGNRIFLPVVSIARSLGDQIIVNPSSRVVEVRRQTGVLAEFNAQLSQVREDGAVILAVSSTADIIFSPNPEELMLPVEIVAPLLDVSIMVDEGQRAVRITRGRSRSSRTVVNHAPWELYQVDYAYNLNLYSTSYYQNLAINATGRIADGRFALVTNLDGGTGNEPLIYRRGTFTFDTADGRRLIAGDFGTGNDLAFLSSTVRGALVQRPYGGARLTAFAGRSSSGVLPSVIDGPLAGQPFDNRSRFDLSFDTNGFGSYATFGPSALKPSGATFLSFSTGGMYFSGPHSSGRMATGSIKYSNERHQFLGDVAAGSFNGITSDKQRADGFAAVVDVSEVFNLTRSFSLQGRFAHISPNFLNPQATGAFNPVRLAHGGMSWRPFRSFGASITGSSVKRLDRDDQTDRSITGTASITPSSKWLPTLLLTRTHTSNTLGGSSDYTLINATRELNRLRLFGNFTRTRNLVITSLTDRSRLVETPPGMTLTTGAIIKLNENHTLQGSQSFGSRGSMSGDFDWMTSSFFTRRISLGAGFGYS